jgi:plasmid stability protein
LFSFFFTFAFYTILYHMSIYSLRCRVAESICPPAPLPPISRKPRIAIDADVLRALRAWAARDGRDADTLATEVLRAALPAEVASFAKLGGAEAPREKTPLDIERQREKPARKGARPWHGGPTPYEDQHPEIAARALKLWAGGRRKGGMSRDAVARQMQAEGISISAAQIDKITTRARKKDI